MNWNIDVAGTPQEVSDAIDALSEVGPFPNSEQIITVKNLMKSGFKNSFGEVSRLMYEGPLQLKAHLNFTYNTFDLSISLQVVKMDGHGNVIGGPPPSIDTRTVPLPPP